MLSVKTSDGWNSAVLFGSSLLRDAEPVAMLLLYQPHLRDVTLRSGEDNVGILRSSYLWVVSYRIIRSKSVASKACRYEGVLTTAMTMIPSRKYEADKLTRNPRLLRRMLPSFFTVSPAVLYLSLSPLERSIL